MVSPDVFQGKTFSSCADAPWPHIKITDFGYCKGPNQSSCKTLLGTSAYMAPEVIIGTTYNGKQADMWSCGEAHLIISSSTACAGCGGVDELTCDWGCPQVSCCMCSSTAATHLSSRTRTLTLQSVGR